MELGWIAPIYMKRSDSFAVYKKLFRVAHWSRFLQIVACSNILSRYFSLKFSEMLKLVQVSTACEVKTSFISQLATVGHWKWDSYTNQTFSCLMSNSDFKTFHSWISISILYQTLCIPKLEHFDIWFVYRSWFQEMCFCKPMWEFCRNTWYSLDVKLKK